MGAVFPEDKFMEIEINYAKADKSTLLSLLYSARCMAMDSGDTATAQFIEIVMLDVAGFQIKLPPISIEIQHLAKQLRLS